MTQNTRFVATGLPDRCSNIACPNKPGEGHFVLVDTETGPEPGSTANSVGKKRPLRFWLCSPCGRTLTGFSMRDGEVSMSTPETLRNAKGDPVVDLRPLLDREDR